MYKCLGTNVDVTNKSCKRRYNVSADFFSLNIARKIFFTYKEDIGFDEMVSGFFLN